MAFSRRAHTLYRRERARRAARPVFVDVVLECGHETREPPLLRFSDGRERFACGRCFGAIRREKGHK